VLYFSRLCYHYAFGHGTRALAFKYTIRAMESAVAREEFPVALLHARNAFSIACSGTEMTVLTLSFSTMVRIMSELDTRSATSSGGIVSFMFGQNDDDNFKKDHSRTISACGVLRGRIDTMTKSLVAEGASMSSTTGGVRLSADVPFSDRDLWDPALLTSSAEFILADLTSSAHRNSSKMNTYDASGEVVASPRGFLRGGSDRIVPDITESYVAVESQNLTESGDGDGTTIVATPNYLCCW
jgi:hypothetical protein